MGLAGLALALLGKGAGALERGGEAGLMRPSHAEKSMGLCMLQGPGTCHCGWGKRAVELGAGMGLAGLAFILIGR